MFHPDGTVSRQGTFIAGRAEGIVGVSRGRGRGRAVALVLRAPGGGPPRPSLREGRHRPGDLLRRRRSADSRGRPTVARAPAGVPDDAEYDEAGAQWARRRTELHRFWTAEGVLTSEIAFAQGVRRAVRTFDAAGRLEEACELSPEGLATARSFDAPAPRRKAPTRPAHSRGARRLRARAGGGTLVVPRCGGRRAPDGGFAVLRSQRGARRPLRRSLRASAGTAQGTAEDTAEDWWALSRSLRAEGRVREALCAAARAAAARGGTRRARACARRRCRPGWRRPSLRNEGKRSNASVGVKVWSILDALVCGADAASAFRALAAVLPGVRAAAADFVEASLCCARAEDDLISRGRSSGSSAATRRGRAPTS